MSRIGRKPIEIPTGVQVSITKDTVSVKGPKGSLSLAKPAGVSFSNDNGIVQLGAANADDMKMAGTVRAILANMFTGVTEGFTRKLELVGVGYRAEIGRAHV